MLLSLLHHVAPDAGRYGCDLARQSRNKEQQQCTNIHRMRICRQTVFDYGPTGGPGQPLVSRVFLLIASRWSSVCV